MMRERLLAIFADMPVLFFAVVIGVALTFRFTVGAIRDASAPKDVAPTFVTGAEPGLATARAEADAQAEARATADADARAKASASAVAKAEVGAAGKVQPLGGPLPAHVAPKPRGHGRRPVVRGGERGEHER
jgi:hypothetical protein